MANGTAPAGQLGALIQAPQANVPQTPQEHAVRKQGFMDVLRDPADLERARKETITKLEIIDQQLATRRYLADDEFTMGDIPAGATVYRFLLFDLERPKLANLDDWQKRLADRDAFQALIAPRENHLA